MNQPYISLQEASKLTPYDANYLGLLIRKKRLFATKKDGKWYTTKESVLQYLNQVSQRSPASNTNGGYSQKSLSGAEITLVSSVFIPLTIIVAIIVFIFTEGVSAKKGTFKISQNETEGIENILLNRHLGVELPSGDYKTAGVSQSIRFVSAVPIHKK